MSHLSKPFMFGGSAPAAGLIKQLRQISHNLRNTYGMTENRRWDDMECGQF